MKAFRRLVYHALPCILLLAILVSGCSAQSTPTNTTPSESTAVPTLSQPTAAEPASITPQSECSSIVTLKLDDWSSTDEARAERDEVLDDFYELYPCIKVEIVSQETSGADAKRLEDMKTGTASDLIAVDSGYIPSYTEAGGLADLSPFLEADAEFKPEEIFFTGVWKSGYYQDIPRAISKDFSTCAIYVNGGLFERAGLTLPREGWTYDEYLSLAQRLTLDSQGRNAADPQFDSGDIVQYGTAVPFLGRHKHRGMVPRLPKPAVFFRHPCPESDGSQVSGYLNGPNSLTAWEYARDLVHKYHVAPDAAFISAQSDGNLSLFKEGKLAMVGNYWGPSFRGTLDATPGLEWAVVPLPSGPAGHKGVIMWMGWGINAKTEHPQEAWELLKWLTTEPGQRPFARRALTQYKQLAVELHRINDPFWGVFLSETEYVDRLDDAAHPRFFSCVSEGDTSRLLYEMWLPGGEQIDLQARLDELAAQAHPCMSATP